jgi:hypothetical protein
MAFYTSGLNKSYIKENTYKIRNDIDQIKQKGIVITDRKNGYVLQFQTNLIPVVNGAVHSKNQNILLSKIFFEEKNPKKQKELIKRIGYGTYENIDKQKKEQSKIFRRNVYLYKIQKKNYNKNTEIYIFIPKNINLFLKEVRKNTSKKLGTYREEEVKIKGNRFNTLYFNGTFGKKGDYLFLKNKNEITIIDKKLKNTLFVKLLIKDTPNFLKKELETSSFLLYKLKD